MKKLLVVPITLLTAALLVAFLSPSTARSAVRAFAPALNLSIGSSTAAESTVDGQSVNGSGSGSAVVEGQDSQAALSSQNSTRPSAARGTTVDGQLLALLANPGDPPPVQHSISTPGHQNCGRYGNGYHGGKHVFVCP